MLVLLDENLPQKLRHLLPGHDVRTTAYQGWKALLNGALLKAAENAGFQIFLTADQGIRYQQNLSERKLSLLVLSTNELSRVLASAENILASVDQAQPGGLVFLDIGR